MGTAEMITRARERAILIRQAMNSPLANLVMTQQAKDTSFETADLLEVMADKIESEWPL